MRATRFIYVLALALLILGLPRVATSQEAQAQAQSPSAALDQANAAMNAGDYPRAEVAVLSVIALKIVRRVERAEAYRILGILNFYEQNMEGARRAFLSYLKLDPDAHLDPAMVPPEAIALLEDVRAKHSAAIDSMRYTPPKKRYFVLNFLPAAGQVQNDENTKAFLVASGFALFLATNIGSYALLSSYCEESTGTCDDNEADPGRNERARTLKTVNLVSGIGLATVYIYSVVDGVRGYRKLRARDRRRRRDNDMSLHVSIDANASTVSLGFDF
jgi:hypothetical protein